MTDVALQAQVATEPEIRSFGQPHREHERSTRMALAGELVASITHDLRQPLTAIEMNVAAALHLLRRDTPRTKEAMEALIDAQEQQGRMRDAVQVLQDLAMNREPFLEMVDPVTIVRDVVKLVSTDAVVRNVPIGLDIIAPIPRVAGEAVLMRQGLLNILLDALEATSSGRHKGMPVRVSVRRASEDVEISVSHYGTRAESRVIDQWGLAVARTVVGTHHATIAIEGDGETGVRVVTRWPIGRGELSPNVLPEGNA